MYYNASIYMTISLFVLGILFSTQNKKLGTDNPLLLFTKYCKNILIIVNVGRIDYLA